MDAEFKKLKKQIEKKFVPIWGPRCKTKDTEDFPDLKKKPESRCMTCASYDKLDAFFADLEKSL